MVTVKIGQSSKWTQNPASFPDTNSYLALPMSPMLAIPACVTWADNSISWMNVTSSVKNSGDNTHQNLLVRALVKAVSEEQVSDPHFRCKNKLTVMNWRENTIGHATQDAQGVSSCLSRAIVQGQFNKMLGFIKLLSSIIQRH